MEDYKDWSKHEYWLSDFVKRFALPQLARIGQGFYTGKEDTTLIWGQILTIHSVKQADTVIAKDSQQRKVFIPKTCSQKVEVLQHGTRNTYYDTVSKLNYAFPRFARVTREPHNEKLNLHVGDKLALKRVMKKKTVLECENQNGVRVRLPMSLQARFVPLQDGFDYFIHEVIHLFKLPIMVQFIDTKFDKSATASTVFSSTLGVLNLEEVMKEETILCSTKDKTTGKRNKITISRGMNITVAPAQGAIDEDEDYVRLCRALSDGDELPKVDALESANIYASRHEIQEYMQLQFLSVESHIYTKPVFPQQLPRIAKNNKSVLFPKSPTNKMKEDDSDNGIYESIQVKSPPIKTQQFTLCNGNQNQDISQVVAATKAMVSDLKTENNKPINSKESKTESEDPSPLPTSPKPAQSATGFPVYQSMTLPNY